MASLVQAASLGFLLLQTWFTAAAPDGGGSSAIPRDSCTTVMLSKDGQVILGDNEDAGSDHPLSADPCAATIWVYPPESERGGRHGCIWIGWPYGNGMSGQAGMNGAGLAFGLTAVPQVEMQRHPELPYSPQIHGGLYYRVLWDCATVDEAIQTALAYDLGSLSYQMLVADGSGDAAIIGPGPDGRIAVTRKGNTDRYLVASTFNAAAGEVSGTRDAKKRWSAAQQALQGENLPGRSPKALVQSALEACHRKRTPLFGSYTMYSVIFDITGHKVHLTFLSDFSHEVSLDLREEMADAPKILRLCELVPTTVQEGALRSYRTTRRKGTAAIAAAAFTIAALAAVISVGLIRRIRKSQP